MVAFVCGPADRDVQGIADRRDGAVVGYQIDEMRERGATVDENGFVGTDMRGRMNAGVRSRQHGCPPPTSIHRAHSPRSGSRHDVAAEIGELIRVARDIAAHRHSETPSSSAACAGA